MSSNGVVAVVTDREQLECAAVVLAGLSPQLVERLTHKTIRGLENLGPTVRAATLDLALSVPYAGVVLSADRPVYLSPHAPVANLAPGGGGLVSLLRYVPCDEVDGNHEAERAELRSLAELAGIENQHVVHERFRHATVFTSPGCRPRISYRVWGRSRRAPANDSGRYRGIFCRWGLGWTHGLLADASAARCSWWLPRPRSRGAALVSR